MGALPLGLASSAAFGLHALTRPSSASALPVRAEVCIIGALLLEVLGMSPSAAYSKGARIAAASHVSLARL
jgi:hypothetical protein